MTGPSGQGNTSSVTASEDGYVGDDESAHTVVQPVVNSKPARGLLDLPSELRVMIFRHLLVDPEGVDLGLWPPRGRPCVEILKTSRLIHREAFGVLWGENHFRNFLGSTSDEPSRFPPIIDAIQNLHVDVPMSLHWDANRHFMDYIHHFGSPDIPRGTLTVEFLVDGPGRFARRLVDWFVPLRWFVRALGRFAHFRTVELHVFRAGVRDGTRSLKMLEYLEEALEPVLGLAEEGSGEEKGVRFHPLDHWRLWNELGDGDWADYLDGIRLEQTEDADSFENVQPGPGEA